MITEGQTWIVCDRCGLMKLLDEDGFETCSRCASPAAWAFPSFDLARIYQRQVMDRVTSQPEAPA